MSDEYMGRLMQFATSPRFKSDYERAFFEYFGLPSQVDLSSPLRERIAFHSWYIFDYRLRDHGLTMAELYYWENADTLPPDERQIFNGFCHPIYALFEVLSTAEDGFVARDLLTLVEYDVEERTGTRRLRPEAVITARLAPFREKYQVGGFLELWPEGAWPYLKEKWADYRNQGLELNLRETIVEMAHMKRELAAQQRSGIHQRGKREAR
jgi:hypothetical protein